MTAFERAFDAADPEARDLLGSLVGARGQSESPGTAGQVGVELGDAAASASQPETRGVGYHNNDQEVAASSRAERNDPLASGLLPELVDESVGGEGRSRETAGTLRHANYQ